eukprot:Skav211295  [mRNA]  locus=C8695960:166:493:+ [translate_table: standard]
MQAHWIEALRTSFGLDLSKIQSDIQTWQERRAAEYMTHAPLEQELQPCLVKQVYLVYMNLCFI